MLFLFWNYNRNMKIYNLNEKKEYAKEYFECCLREWGTFSSEEEFTKKIDRKVESFSKGENKKIISVLLLLEDKNLIGFISLFKEDGEERKDLTPWYATMYVKEEYRGNGYSKILNSAILEEAKRLGYSKVYLKTELSNYYEKFGAKYLEKLNATEKLYCINLFKIDYQLINSKEEEKEKIKEYKLNSILDYADDLEESEMTRIKEYVEENISQDIYHYQSIFVNNKLIGCLLVEPEETGILLDEIYLEKEYRGKGIGTEIIKDILDKNSIVSLWVYKKNKNAIKLYEKLGFVIVEETESRYYMKTPAN